MTALQRTAQSAELVMPFAMFCLMPVLPMLVLLADVLPRGVAIGGKGYAVAFAVIMTLATLVTLGGILVRRGWRGLVEPPLTLPLLAVIATATLAGVIGVSFNASLFEIISEIGNLIAFVAIYWRMSDDRTRRALLVCYFTAGIIATVFGVALTVTRHPPEMFAYQHGRAAGTFLQPNEFGGYLLFFISLGLAQAGAPVLLRRLGGAAAMIGIVALALSVSRAAWLGLIIGLPVLVARFGRRAMVLYALRRRRRARARHDDVPRRRARPQREHLAHRRVGRRAAHGRALRAHGRRSDRLLEGVSEPEAAGRGGRRGPCA